MREIIRVERKRILNLRSFLLISIVILIFSLFNSKKSLEKYNVYDSSGTIIISSKENLRESRLKKHNLILNKKTLKEVVDRKDTSRYLYNFNLVRLVSFNYKDKKVDELTENDIEKFYSQRISNLRNYLEENLIYYTDKDIGYLISKGKELKTPLKTGYSEGWKNLNNDMADFTLIILGVISIIILPLFTHDQKTKMKELYVSTKYGKRTLVKCRIVAGIQVGVIIYSIGLFIFSLSKLMAFGIRGFNLPIQNNINNFLSTYNITYLQQYLINILIGFIAMLLMISIIYLFTILVEQILSGGVLILSFWAMMNMLPKNIFSLNHYFANFLPYKMTDFNHYYMNNEVYTILGKTIPNIICVIIVSFIFFILFTILTMFISNIKLSSKLK